LLEVEEQESMNKQIKQDILLTNVKAHNIMENCNNNLKEEMERLAMLSVELESKLDDPMVSIDLRQQVQATQNFVEVFKWLVVGGAIEYKRICKDAELQNSRLFSLEQKIASYKQNCDGAKNLVLKFEQGRSGHWNGLLVSLPSQLIEHNEVGFKECFMIE
jgi:hypothetical protein